jgi:acyl-CoA thioesterase I
MKKFSKYLLLEVSMVIISLALYFMFIDLTNFGINKNESIKSSENVSQDKAEKTIIAFGDSLTAGYGLPLSESYPAQLETVLRGQGKSVKVINTGVSGETSFGNLERAKFIREQNSDIVILGIGGNDALRNLSVIEMRENLSKTIETLQSGINPPTVFLLSIVAPANLGLKYKREFDAVYTDLAKEYKLKLIPFVVPEVFTDKSFMTSDGIHPNKDGYKVLIDKYILPSIIESL